MKKSALFFVMMLTMISGRLAAETTESDAFYILGAPRPVLAVRQPDNHWVPAWFDLRIGVVISSDRSLQGLRRFAIYVDARKMNIKGFPKACMSSFIQPWGDYEKTFTGSADSARPPYDNLWPTRFSKHGEEVQIIQFDDGACKVRLEIGGPSGKYLKNYPGITGDYLRRTAKTHTYPNDLGMAFNGKHGRITFSDAHNTDAIDFVIEHNEESLGLGSFYD